MKRLVSLFLPLAALLTTGCGSPLLDHANANEILRQPISEDVACPLAFPKFDLCGSFTWDRKPTSSTPGSAVLRFWNRELGTPSGPYVSPVSTVFVKLWMPVMGHGSSPVTTAAKKDAGGMAILGVFDSTNVFFVMPGKWEIWVQLKSGAAIDAQAKLDVEI